MNETITSGLRRPPSELADRYVESGLWTSSGLGDLLARTLTANADEEFVFHSPSGDQRGRIADVGTRADQLAAGLRARGIMAGDVVAVQMPNSFDAVAAFCAVALAGAVVVPIVHFSSATDCEYILRVTGAQAFLTSDQPPLGDWLERVEYLGRTVSNLEFIAVSTARPSLPARVISLNQLAANGIAADTGVAVTSRSPAELVAVNVEPSSPAMIAFTSGTTAAPKGVVHSHQTLCFEATQFAATVPPGPPIAMGAPVSHILGLLSGVVAPLLNGSSIHLLNGWNPAHVLAVMAKEQVRAGSGPPLFLTTLLDEPGCTAAHQRLIDPCRLGGAPVPEALIRRGEELGLTVLRIYGSTEHPSIASGMLGDPREKRLSTSGRPLPGCEVRIAHDGEIQTRGADLFLGYLDPSDTAAAFDEDGWFSTGDIGALDADGYLSILDRKKDIIIRGGENISAQEVEEQVAGLPGVAEVAVVGGPDPRLGEIVVAFLRLRGSAPEPSIEDVQTHCRTGGLARHKAPQRLIFVADFPRTPSGKISKARLRADLDRVT